ncbi:hypothetical protein BRADI_4g14175v3 [Brachypodium distachyon]|uniref:Uncharacterized protein n=1 Tax=Brachypodium distachyon TaxID=15368 RepID=A0A0Q3L5H9_BRADI|nr:hypothetical protein BRADI_4g14175v3 [Brachypodium distachyon]
MTMQLPCPYRPKPPRQDGTAGEHPPVNIHHRSISPAGGYPPCTTLVLLRLHKFTSICSALAQGIFALHRFTSICSALHQFTSICSVLPQGIFDLLRPFFSRVLLLAPDLCTSQFVGNFMCMYNSRFFMRPL